MRKSFIIFGVSATLLLAAVVGSVQVAGQGPLRWVAPLRLEHPAVIGSTRGSDTYGAYCAVCHGPLGKGDGPAAESMEWPVPDLTMLARQNHGEFAYKDVEMAIRGQQKPVGAHESAEMPAWGPIFRTVYPEDAEQVRLRNLVAYLRTMQEK